MTTELILPPEIPLKQTCMHDTLYDKVQVLAAATGSPTTVAEFRPWCHWGCQHESQKGGVCGQAPEKKEMQPSNWFELETSAVLHKETPQIHLPTQQRMPSCRKVKSTSRSPAMNISRSSRHYRHCLTLPVHTALEKGEHGLHWLLGQRAPSF